MRNSLRKLHTAHNNTQQTTAILDASSVLKKSLKFKQFVLNYGELKENWINISIKAKNYL